MNSNPYQNQGAPYGNQNYNYNQPSNFTGNNPPNMNPQMDQYNNMQNPNFNANFQNQQMQGYNQMNPQLPGTNEMNFNQGNFQPNYNPNFPTNPFPENIPHNPAQNMNLYGNQNVPTNPNIGQNQYYPGMQQQVDPPYNKNNEQKGKHIPYSNIPQPKGYNENFNVDRAQIPENNQNFVGYQGAANFGNPPQYGNPNEGHYHKKENNLNPNIQGNMQNNMYEKSGMMPEEFKNPAIPIPDVNIPKMPNYKKGDIKGLEMPPIRNPAYNPEFQKPYSNINNPQADSFQKHPQENPYEKIRKNYTNQPDINNMQIPKQQAKHLLFPQDEKAGDFSKSIAIDKGNFISVNSGDVKQLYTFKKQVGKGSFGEVWDCENKVNHNRVAIKMISKKKIHQDQAMKKQMKLEFDLLRKLDHPNIMRIFDAFENYSDIFIVSEFMEGGELAKRTDNKVLREKEVCNIISQILRPLAYCHSKGVAHRDLKPENAMYENKSGNATLKLIDFGLSAIVDRRHCFKEVLGSPLYMAPEIVIESAYNEKCDIWSCGIMMYSFLSSSVPFVSQNIDDLFKEIKSVNFTMKSFSGSHWRHVSENAKKFLLKMLQKDPSKRASAVELVNDPYLNSSCPEIPLSSEDEALMMQNIVKFAQESSFQRLIKNFIASSISTSESIQEVRKEFMIIDKNNDGRISKKEWLNGSEMISANLRIPMEEMEIVFDKINSNKDGYIDYTEFLAASLNNFLTSDRKNLEMAFQFLDKDNDGYISSEEFKKIFKGDYGKFKPIIDKIISDISSHGNQKIYKEDFIKAMQNVALYHQNQNY